MKPVLNRQRGATLLVGLIMLVLMTLIAVTSFNLGRSNLQVVANMQNRAESVNSVKATLEEVISRTDFTNNPAAALINGCAANTKCFDVNGDGTTDVTVTLNPVPCIKKTQIIKNSQLDLNKPNDFVCSTQAGQTLGITGSAIGNSQCADTIWEVAAVAADNVTQASVTAIQGVAVRVSADAGSNPAFLCP